MATDPRLNPGYVLQEDVIRDYIPSLGRQRSQVIYASTEQSPDSFAVFSGPVPRGKVSTALAQESSPEPWLLRIAEARTFGTMARYNRAPGACEVACSGENAPSPARQFVGELLSRGARLN